MKKVEDNLMRNNSNLGKEVKVLAQHIGLSVSKARRVIDQIRGRSYKETLMILHLMPYQASYPILKLVSSAAANANHNMGLKEVDSYISKAEVNRSTIVKKLRPRAKGHSYPIKRTMCHLTIVLKEKKSKSLLDLRFL
uniref:ribosomal protein L22 n=1 Tax=Juncus gracilicaulis TaxID=511724 RepID=UPI001F13980E|nr:ribosomal protein L22 [Juncus gracilicaulis]YP_010291260.1 ribosomal protein L22 [Juncus gracilicaulis]ULQ66828.1 ribosomal protein L22 [Juncus gracilicaulis]ULQ66850.1 ribosomal protein L22 [Juncus gracilicaulis]